MRFSIKELKDLGISALVIGFIFTWTMRESPFSMSIVVLFLVMLTAVGTAFIFHELAHKYTAQKYGCWAEYRMWDTGLVIAFFLAVVMGFVFVAPGAVYIQCYGMISRRENGIISAAGAATNLVLAALFWMLHLTGGAPALKTLGTVGYFVNAWIALFNMIPFPPFDGSKVLSWNFKVWLAIIAVALLLLEAGGM